MHTNVEQQSFHGFQMEWSYFSPGRAYVIDGTTKLTFALTNDVLLIWAHNDPDSNPTVYPS